MSSTAPRVLHKFAAPSVHDVRATSAILLIHGSYAPSEPSASRARRTIVARTARGASDRRATEKGAARSPGPAEPCAARPRGRVFRERRLRARLPDAAHCPPIQLPAVPKAAAPLRPETPQGNRRLAADLDPDWIADSPAAPDGLPPRAGGVSVARSRSDLERHRLRERVRSLEAQLRSQAELDALVAQVQDRQEERRVQDAALIDTQHELELSRDRHAELYDFAPVALASLDSSGLIEAINIAGARVLGRERAEVIGFPLATFVAKPWRRILRDYLAACRREGAPAASVDLEFDASGGGTLPIELCCKRFTPHGGAPIYFAALVDLSERRRADADRVRADADRLRADADQARVERQESVARAANEAKDRFLAVLSHELRTPLTPVLLTLDRLAQLTGDEVELRKGLETIRRNLNVETHLIDDLLDLTRIARNKLHLTADVVDLHSALDHAIEMCGAEAARAGLSLEVDLADGKPFVRGDGTRLRQVFWNLLSNAIRYTPSGGVVRVRSRVFGNQIGIDVSDTGRGIALEDLDRVFSAFEQVGHDPILSGLGLGLAICRGLVEAHGGKIRAASPGSGRGATFSVALPTCAAPAQRVERRPEVSPHRGLRILVVEDNADTAEALGVLLRLQGHVVRLAHSLVEARRVRPEGFDVLLSDLHLPDGSGLDLLRELVAERPIHAIAMSGYGTESDVRRSRDAGFERHLVKPVSIESVIEAIEFVAPLAAAGRTREILST